MAQYPSAKDDTVLYEQENVIADQNIKITLLDGSTLEVWGQVFFNGLPVGSVGTIPIATQPEAEAGTNNTNAMTPLRTSQAIDAQVDTVLNGHIASGTAHAATNITATPNASPMVGTNVQTQLSQAATQLASVSNTGILTSQDLVDHVTDTVDAHDASAISAVAGASPLTGVNVQAQLDQARTGINGQTSLISALDSSITAHTTDTVDAHDASAISAVPNTAPMVGTDVQTQLTQARTEMTSIAATVGTQAGSISTVQTNVDAHINDTVDAHDASAISALADTFLSGTDVQAQLASVKAVASGTYTYVENYAPPSGAYLVPTVGTATCADPGPLPAECVFVFKTRGPIVSGTATNHTIAAQYEASGQRSWLLRNSESTRGFVWNASTDGTAATTISWAALPLVTTDQFLAIAFDSDIGGGNQRLDIWESIDGVTWTQNSQSKTDPSVILFDSSSVVRIGGFGVTTADIFDGRIYSVELKAGLNPASGTTVWKFDASDYPGTGTSYSDPRGRTWNLTSASAITVPRVPKVNDIYIDTTADTLYRHDGTSWTNQGVIGDATVSSAVQQNTAQRPHIYLPATTGNNITTPDPTVLAGATELDIRFIEKAPVNGIAGYNGSVIAAQGGSSGSDLGFVLIGFAGTEHIRIGVSTTGGAPSSYSANRSARPAVGISTYKLTWRASDGRVQVFTKSSSDVASMISNTGWIQSSTDVISTVGAMFNSTQPLSINGYGTGSAPHGLNILASSFATTIDGTPFALWRSDTMDETLLDAYGTKWIVNGSAWEWRDSGNQKIGSPVQTTNELNEILQYAAPKTHLYLPQINGNFISTPDSAILAGATELDIRWIEKAPPNGIAGYTSGILANQATSSPVFAFTIGGAAGSDVAILSTNSNTALYLNRNIRPTSGIGACRLVWRASDGRAQAFKKSTADVAVMLDNTGWTQIGADAIIGSGPLNDQPQPITINAYPTGVSSGTQRALAWSFATTIDGTPFALWRADSSEQQYRDAYNNLWTINGTAWEWRDNNHLRIDSNNIAEPLIGTGYPEGVISAPVGTPYTDIAATNGAIQWVKATGISNTGWKVVYGDTGWRTISSWDAAGVVTGDPLPASWAPRSGVAGFYKLRRTNNSVSIYLGQAAVAVAQIPNTFILPTGYGITNGTDFAVNLLQSTTVPVTGMQVLAVIGVTFGRAAGQSLNVGDYVPSTNITYITDNAWPSTLPGV